MRLSNTTVATEKIFVGNQMKLISVENVVMRGVAGVDGIGKGMGDDLPEGMCDSLR